MGEKIDYEKMWKERQERDRERQKQWRNKQKQENKKVLTVWISENDRNLIDKLKTQYNEESNSSLISLLLREHKKIKSTFLTHAPKRMTS